MATYGPKPRWGDRSPCKVHWPSEHRAVYERAAQEAGLSLNEYLIRVAARAHGITIPGDQDDARLSMSA